MAERRAGATVTDALCGSARNAGTLGSHHTGRFAFIEMNTRSVGIQTEMVCGIDIARADRTR